MGFFVFLDGVRASAPYGARSFALNRLGLTGDYPVGLRCVLITVRWHELCAWRFVAHAFADVRVGLARRFAAARRGHEAPT